MKIMAAWTNNPQNISNELNVILNETATPALGHKLAPQKIITCQILYYKFSTNGLYIAMFHFEKHLGLCKLPEKVCY